MNRRRTLLIALAVPAVLVLVAFLFLAWLAATGSGLRFAARMAERMGPPGLEIQNPSGSLLGPLEIGRLTYKTPERRVVAEDISLQWQPRELMDDRLHIDRLAIGRLRISGAPEEKKPDPPKDLTLPVALRVDRFEIGEVYTAPPEAKAPEPLLTNVTGSFASDGQQHRLENLQFATSRLAVQAQGALGGLPPFPVTASGQVSGEELDHPFTVAVEAGGTLGALEVKAHSTQGNLKVNGTATLDAFAPQPVRQATLEASGLDPAAWVEGAPHAELSIDARISPAEGEPEVLAGRATVVNAQPGRLDEEKIPLVRLEAQVRQDGERVRVPSFTATLLDGRITGSALWAEGALAVDARAVDVNAAAWHQKAVKTSLSGPITARASAQSQSLEAELRDPRFTLDLDAARRDGIIRIETARLASRGGSLEVGGTLDPEGEYNLEGRLKDFDPSVFANVPKGRLNATLDAEGQMGEKPTMDLHFALENSRLAGRPVSGRGDVVLRPDRLEQADITLRAGDNRLEAHGALGTPGDELKATIDAPRLEQVGLGGSLQGQATLFGPLNTPGAEWNLKSPRLQLPDGTLFRDMASRGRLEPGAASIDAILKVGAVDPAGEAPMVADVSARIEGERSRHRIEASARVGDENAVELAAVGGLDDTRTWKGQVETLAWKGPNPIRLADSARVEAGPGRVLVDGATLAGEDWRATIDGFSWQPGQLKTAGRFADLPVAPFLEAAAPSSTLRLGGEWKVDLGQRPTGRVRIFRQGGDLALGAGGETLSLGLEKLTAVADITGNRVEIVVDGYGTRAGTLAGRLTAGLRREGGHWTLARHAPWQGRLALNTPSIAWLSPLAGENVLLGGRLEGDVAIAGTPAAPEVNGEISGNGLRIRHLDYGLDLGGGSLLVEFNREVARLHRLEMVSVATQRPNEGRIDYRRLTAEPGRLIAEGEISMRTGAGRIGLRAIQLAVSQLPDRWVMVSGNGGLRFTEGHLDVQGDLVVDAAYVEFAAGGRPTLSEDVVVVGRPDEDMDMRVSLDVDVTLGDAFYFQGAGIETRLVGEVHLVAAHMAQLRARGTVRTVGGTFDAYGRELTIERGILNFRGLVDNPGLNVLAVRKNLPVEAGVEVTGTLKDPRVRLVSDPGVPDTEKLSWLLLGRPPGEGIGAQDANLLLSAAMALRGGNGGKGPLESLTQGLGLDEFSFGSGTLGERSRFPTSHVAGSFTPGGAATAAEQIATVGKRISSNVVLSYERSITTAESILKLTVELSRRLSLIGRVGTFNSLGFLYSFSFGGGEQKKPARERQDK